MGRILLQALYARNRLHSKRYCFLELRPGEDLSSTVYDCLTKAVLAAAVIVRYLADDDTEDDYATCGRETVEVLCETMKKILQSGADHILPSPGMYDIQSAVL